MVVVEDGSNVVVGAGACVVVVGDGDAIPWLGGADVVVVEVVVGATVVVVEVVVGATVVVVEVVVGVVVEPVTPRDTFKPVVGTPTSLAALIVDTNVLVLSA